MLKGLTTTVEQFGLCVYVSAKLSNEMLKGLAAKVEKVGLCARARARVEQLDA